jgi:hypothetical protein
MTIPLRAGLMMVRMAAVSLLMLAAAGRAAEPEAAPSGEVAQLRQQVAQLRQSLERLDERLRQLERTGPPAGAAAKIAAPAGEAPPSQPNAAAPAAATAVASAPEAATAPTPGTALGAHEQAVLQEQVRTADALNAWRAVHAGMGQEEVRRLLGDPSSTLPVGNRTGWIYTYRNAGKGSVFLNHDGIVVSLISPGQGALHLY